MHADQDDRHPWLREENLLIQRLLNLRTPVLGVCLGAQLLAKASHAPVGPSAEPEIGWFPVDTDVPDLIAPGPYLQWHWDRFVPPPGSTELARNAVGAQAFVRGSALGEQFHPEATPQMLRRWSSGVTGTFEGTSIDPAEVIAEAQRREPEARARADLLVASFVSGVLTGRPVPAGH